MHPDAEYQEANMNKFSLLLIFIAALTTGCSDSSDSLSMAPESASADTGSASGQLIAPPVQKRRNVAAPTDSVFTEVASLSGTVEATQPFQAAQVYAMNVTKDILYMVYTQNGNYEAVNLMPGTYEVSVRKFGMTADSQSFEVKAGDKITANFSLVEGEAPAAQQALYGSPEGTVFVPFDELFPPTGVGYQEVMESCLGCHPPSFFGQQSMPGVFWDSVVDRMIARGHIPTDTYNDQQKQNIASYLTANFGLDSVARSVPADFPLDEEALGRAQYIEYYMPLDPVLDANNPRRFVQEPHIDWDGNVWFTERTVPNRIGKLDPRTGNVTDYVLPDIQGDPHGLTVDSNGWVWWAETDGWHLGNLNPANGEITRISMDPENDGKIVGRGHTPYLDSSENVWFSTRDFILEGVDSDFDGIGKYDREAGGITLYMEPTADSRPYGLLVDVNDHIWTGLSRGCGVAKFDPITEEWSEYFVPGYDRCAVRRLGVNSDASTVWFGVYSDGKMARLDTASGQITLYDIPMFTSQPYDTWVDPDDKVWVSDGGQGGTLIHFDPDTEEFTYYPTAQFTDLPKLAIGSNGAVWYPARSARRGAVGVLYPDKYAMTTFAALPGHPPL